jgi:hypothetical protein
VQLHFLSGSLSAPGWFGWRVFLLSRPCVSIYMRLE